MNDKGAYLIDNGEYIRPELPSCPLLDETVRSITDQED